MSEFNPRALVESFAVAARELNAAHAAIAEPAKRLRDAEVAYRAAVEALSRAATATAGEGDGG